jgi:hypothetical protein
MSEGTEAKVFACWVLGGAASTGVLLADPWYVQVACALVALICTVYMGFLVNKE